jgi:NADH-quinone oxidoreductase subunit J
MSALLTAATETGRSTIGGNGEAVLFWIVAPLAVLAALGLVFTRKAVHAALCMAWVMISLGIVYFAQQAPFLGAVQIFVYTGAVMMLFLFVLMLVGVDSSDSLVETIKGQRWFALVFGVGLAALVISVIGDVTYPEASGLQDVDAGGNITALAGLIFGTYVWAFEVTSALLITAALGAMILAHRERLTPKPTQRELSIKRIREGAVKAPLPAPGVFARHNAVDTPALLPDGTPSELSVSRVLTARGQMRNVSTVADDVAVIEAELNDPLGEQGPRVAGEGRRGTVPGDATERAAGGGQAGGGRGDTGGSTDRTDGDGGAASPDGRGPGA